MKKIFFFLSIVFLCNHTFSQSKPAASELDNVLRSLQTAKEDTNKVNMLNRLGFKYQWDEPKQAIEYCLASLSLSRKLDYKSGEINAVWSLGEALAMSGNYIKATELKFKGLEMAEQMGNYSLIRTSLLYLAGGFFYQGDYERCISYTRKGMAINARDNGPFGQIVAYGFLGESFYKLDQLDSALFYIQKAYEIDLLAEVHWTVPYVILAGIYSKKGDYARALEYYKKSILYRDLGQAGAFDGYIGLATVFQQMGQTDSAMFYVRKTILEANRFFFPLKVIEAATIGKEIYKKAGLQDSAFFYLELMITAKDSLFSHEKMRAIQNLTFSEQLRQQELEEKKIKEAEERRRNLQYAAIAIALITFIILFLLLSRSIIVKTKFIEFFSVLGLLAVFEFINLFIHPYLDRATSHSPVWMLAILICIGALLVPLHHKLEKWITKIMVEKNKKIRLAAAKKTIATLEGEQTK